MKWYEISDDEFIRRSAKYTSGKEYAQSYGMKNTSEKFRERMQKLGISYGKRNKFSEEDLLEAVKNSDSISGVIRYLSGGEYVRSYYNHVVKEANEYGIKLPRYGKGDYIPNSYISDRDFFSEGSRRSGASIRTRLIRLGMPYECSVVGCPLAASPVVVHNKGVPRVMWLGKEITLQVDHIDGNNTNNLRTNLRFLCPNCHAATDTYVGRNTDRSSIPPAKIYTCGECGKSKFKSSKLCQECRIKSNREKADNRYPPVLEVITGIEGKGLSQYSKDIGVSDNALRKYLNRSGVTKIPRKVKVVA